MKEDIIEPMTLYCDNTSAINISKNPMMVQDKEVKMEYINTKEQIADVFTKALPKDAHEYLRGKLGVIPL